MKFKLPFTQKNNIILFIFLILLIIGLFFTFRSIILNPKLDSKNIEIVYEPRGKYEYIAYLKIKINGKTIIGPKNMVLQDKDKDRSVIETIDLLNNGRKQIVINSFWGPYSTVTYLFDYDGNTLKSLCREPSKQELSSEYNEIFKDYPDNGFCSFMASRGKSIEDVDNDKVKEIIIVGNLINHVCPAVRITTYKWNGKIFVIKSEEESQRPDLKECSPLPSVYPVTTNSYSDSGKKCSDGNQCQSGWCLDQANSLNWKCSSANIFIFDPQRSSFISEFVVINSKVYFVYSSYPYSSSHFRTIDIGTDDGSQEFKLLKERLCTRKINEYDPKITCREGYYYKN